MLNVADNTLILNVVTLSVVMLNVIMLSVVAPSKVAKILDTKSACFFCSQRLQSHNNYLHFCCRED
jgi:hypothetical protein